MLLRTSIDALVRIWNILRWAIEIRRHCYRILTKYTFFFIPKFRESDVVVPWAPVTISTTTVVFVRDSVACMDRVEGVEDRSQLSLARVVKKLYTLCRPFFPCGPINSARLRSCRAQPVRECS